MEKFITANSKTGALMLLLGVPMAVSAGVYFALEYMRKKKPHSSTQHMSLVALHGGQQVLQRLIDYHGARAKLNRAEAKMEELLNIKYPDMKKLQSAVAKLEMTNRNAQAAERLKVAFDSAEQAGNRHEAYEFEMLYVEMLVYKGEWKAALDCKCLKEQKITDARRPLFKAIIYILSDNVSEGKKYWEEFREIRENFHLTHISGDDEPCDLANNFNEFKNIVELLRQDIKNVKPV